MPTNHKTNARFNWHAPIPQGWETLTRALPGLLESRGSVPSIVAVLQGLVELGYEIVSTGGSATAIEKAGVPVKRVEELTGFPEMLDGAEGCK
jgi:phosphoribosylaminoimidazolecarboxamide formyltransferase/IMP cyclohydrolase